MADSIARYRIRVTLATAAILGMVASIIGWSIPPHHPDDRLGNTVIAGIVSAALGALIGYVGSSVYYRRMSLMDAFVCISIPILMFVGFMFGKSGDWFRFHVLRYGALAMIAYLGLRVCFSRNSGRKSRVNDASDDASSTHVGKI